ncbi:MAG: universal stress protein [Steroidobacteraceae bacterium]
MYRNILVPIDGSDTAKRGLREAMILAKGNGTTLRLIHVVNTAVIALEYAETYAPTDDWSEGRRVVGEAALKEAEDIVKQNGLHSESVMLESAIDNTGELIVKQAVDWPADVIVMGTHGRRGLSRLVLGSNAEYVVRHAPVPVLLVRMQSKS